MLPTNYRFVVQNVTGGDIAASGVVILIKRTKIGPTDNAVTVESAAVTLTNAAIISNGTFGVIGAAQDNSIGQFFEGNGNYKVTTAGTNGDARLYMQTSPDGTEWPDNALAQVVPAVINFTAATTKDTDFGF